MIHQLAKSMALEQGGVGELQQILRGPLTAHVGVAGRSPPAMGLWEGQEWPFCHQSLSFSDIAAEMWVGS